MSELEAPAQSYDYDIATHAPHQDEVVLSDTALNPQPRLKPLLSTVRSTSHPDQRLGMHCT